MKKNYSYYLVLIVVPFIAFTFLSLSGGRDGQYSGSPGDGFANCSSCHSGGSFGAVAEITTNIPTSGFVYGDTYEVTVSVTSSSTKHGFQLTTEDASNSKVGTYSAGIGNQIVNSGTHMTHTGAGNQQTSWTFDWTAPSSAEGGEITFYAAVNATNANSSTSGDQVVTTSLSYLVSTVGLNEYEKVSFDVYPNPSNDFIYLKSEDNLLKNAVLTISNYNGKIVKRSTNLSDKIDVSDLSSGVYVVQIISDNANGYSKFIKK